MPSCRVRRAGWGRGDAAVLRVGVPFPGLSRGCIPPVPAGVCPCSAAAVATQRHCPSDCGLPCPLAPIGGIRGDAGSPDTPVRLSRRRGCRLYRMRVGPAADTGSELERGVGIAAGAPGSCFFQEGKRKQKAARFREELYCFHGDCHSLGEVLKPRSPLVQAEDRTPGPGSLTAEAQNSGPAGQSRPGALSHGSVAAGGAHPCQARPGLAPEL